MRECIVPVHALHHVRRYVLDMIDDNQINIVLHLHHPRRRVNRINTKRATDNP